jgi:hypothetical protein
MPEKSYAHRALIDKLNVKEGARVLVLGVKDNELWAAMCARSSECSEARPKKNCDVILLSVESIVDLRKIESCQHLLAPAGGLWVVYPKGQKHITEAQVMEAGLATGMVDNKVVSFSPTHTGLRFVIRKIDRPKSIVTAGKAKKHAGDRKGGSQERPSA